MCSKARAGRVHLHFFKTTYRKLRGLQRGGNRIPSHFCQQGTKDVPQSQNNFHLLLHTTYWNWRGLQGRERTTIQVMLARGGQKVRAARPRLPKLISRFFFKGHVGRGGAGRVMGTEFQINFAGGGKRVLYY